ncbi:hypothetical protein [Larkinella soli]|uniref:hypothetical protein n=1 Tax=Larkinella soli TaxID=1770527 RepID=UPI000FFBBFCF|nr:hypothetical protein [Larkinella soli]
MRALFLLCLCLGLLLRVAGQTPRIQNIRLTVDESGRTVRIMYDLTGIRPGDSISVAFQGAGSGRITLLTVQGDLGTNVKDGTNRSIRWDVVKDNVQVDENGVVLFSIRPAPARPTAEKPTPQSAPTRPQPVSRAPAVERRPSILLPVAGFAVAAGLGAFSQVMPTNYKAYRDKTIDAPSQAEIDDINKKIALKQVAYVAAAVLAAADLSYLILRPKSGAQRTAVVLGASFGTPSLTLRRQF